MTDDRDEILLAVENLEVVYHNVSTAVQGVSLGVARNRIVALLGVNGAGKTTTLRAISGFLGVDNAKVTEGFITFRGEQIQGKFPHQIAQKGLVLVPERDKVFESLTVEENLEIAVPCTGKAHNPILHQRVFEYFPLLGKVRNRLAGYLSGGERQMLALATALLCQPRLLLVDELSLGLAPIIVRELMNLLKLICNEQGISILLVEQNAVAALEIADYGYVIENGRIVLAGNRDMLKNDQNIKDFYLGQGQKDSRRSYAAVKQYRRTRRCYG